MKAKVRGRASESVRDWKSRTSRGHLKDSCRGALVALVALVPLRFEVQENAENKVHVCAVRLASYCAVEDTRWISTGKTLQPLFANLWRAKNTSAHETGRGCSVQAQKEQNFARKGTGGTGVHFPARDTNDGARGVVDGCDCRGVGFQCRLGDEISEGENDKDVQEEGEMAKRCWCAWQGKFVCRGAVCQYQAVPLWHISK